MKPAAERIAVHQVSFAVTTKHVMILPQRNAAVMETALPAILMSRAVQPDAVIIQLNVAITEYANLLYAIIVILFKTLHMNVDILNMILIVNPTGVL